MSTDYATKHRWQNRVRWRIASTLNRLPRTCWANLVSWALHSRPLLSRDGDDIRQDWMCAPSNCGRCYCGKRPTPAPTAVARATESAAVGAGLEESA